MTKLVRPQLQQSFFFPFGLVFPFILFSDRVDFSPTFLIFAMHAAAHAQMHVVAGVISLTATMLFPISSALSINLCVSCHPQTALQC